MNDTDEIMETLRRFGDAWSKGDVATLLGFFTDDARRVSAFGDVSVGRAALGQAFTAMFQGAFKGARVKLDPPAIRMIGADHALCETRMEILAPERTLKGVTLDVLVKKDGAWKILETHPKLFPPPPPGK